VATIHSETFLGKNLQARSIPLILGYFRTPVSQENAMKARPTICTIALLLFAASSSAPTSAAEMYDLDTSHMSIVFSCSHMNMSYTYGIFRKADGRFMLDRTNPAGCRFQMTIDASSIDTNQPQRDQHLKSPDFFNVAQFPSITFESTSVAQGSSQQGVVYQVTGNLTMHGVTKQIVLPMQMLGEGKSPDGSYHAGFMTQFTLNRSDFGMDKLLNMVGDPIGITVSFEGKRADGDTGAAAQPAPPR
jgi:polyisoprenoid-binding protein YceI